MADGPSQPIISICNIWTVFLSRNCYRFRQTFQPKANVSICNNQTPFYRVFVTDQDKPFEGNPNVSICNSKIDVWVLVVTDQDNLGADARAYNVKRRGARVMGAPAHVGQGLRSGGRK